jgi:hypothetical protein
VSGSASELACRLAREAEAVCRCYLSNGRREGRSWLVGDVRNTPGRSLFVRLKGTEGGKGAAGKWLDAATSERGDLIDLIRLNQGLTSFRDTLDEAQRFLGEPRKITSRRRDGDAGERDTVAIARRIATAAVRRADADAPN